jgi:uncharacterized protein
VDAESVDVVVPTRHEDAMPIYERRIELPVDAARAFALHERPDALETLVPPWEKVTVLEPPRSLEVGTRVVLRMNWGPVSLQWVAKHTRYEPPLLFEDVQERGPFWRWVHQHRFENLPGETARCVLVDHVEYALFPGPLAPMGWLFDGLVRRRLDRMFAYRHERTLAWALAQRRAL